MCERSAKSKKKKRVRWLISPRSAPPRLQHAARAAGRFGAHGRPRADGDGDAARPCHHPRPGLSFSRRGGEGLLYLFCCVFFSIFGETCGFFFNSPPVFLWFFSSVNFLGDFFISTGKPSDPQGEQVSFSGAVAPPPPRVLWIGRGRHFQTLGFFRVGSAVPHPADFSPSWVPLFLENGPRGC